MTIRLNKRIRTKCFRLKLAMIPLPVMITLMANSQPAQTRAALTQLSRLLSGIG